MSECDFGELWPLYSSMVPAILECSMTDTLPCLFCHHHCLKEADSIYIPLTSIVLLKCTEAELMSIVGFEAANDSSIKRLDVGCETRPKVDESYTFGFILNGMARKVVQSESDVVVFQLQFHIPFFNPPKL